MFEQGVLLRVIGKLMMQVEEEKRRRDEAIQICINRNTLIDLSPLMVPTDEQIHNRIRELSQ